MRTEKTFLAVLGGVFAVSGFTGLVYQAVFNKVFSFVFGVGAYAAATVLATFMLGLALGSHFTGKLTARRLRRLLVIYGVMELLLGLYALGFLQISQLVEQWYVPLARDAHLSLQTLTAIRFVSTLLLVGIPTTLMGGSLPLLVEAARRRGLKSSVNVLYAINVGGAAAGTVLAAYVFLPRLHLDGSLTLIFVCTVVVLIGSLIAEAILPEGPPAPAVVTDGVVAAPSPMPRWILLFAFASGFLTFANEIYWFHMLGLVVGTSTYAYSIMLFTTLLGMTLGGGITERFLRRGGDANQLLLRSNLALAATTLVTLPLWDEIPGLFLGLGMFVKSFEARELVRFVASSALILPSAICAGLVFPVVLHRVETASRTPGAAVGTINAVNTVGTIAGSLLSGFVLLQWLGGRGGLLFTALGSIAIVLGLVELPRRRRLTLVGGALGVWIVAAVAMPGWDVKKLLSGANIYFEQSHDDFEELVWQHEDYVGGVTSVIQRGEVRTMLTNGKFQGNNGNEVKDQNRCALLPNLFVRNTGRALNIGLGTAGTLHAIDKFPYQHIDAVELSADVVHAAREYFTDINERVLESPRVAVHVQDGRNFLQLHDPSKPYDLISIELSSIWFAGAGNLYNDEFYALAKANMAPGAVLQQWVQLHHTQVRDIAVIIATLRRHFRHVQLWLPGHQGILVASDEPLVVVEARVRDLERGFAKSDFFLDEPRTVLGELLLSAEQLDRFLADVAPSLPVPYSTDHNLYLEYSTPRGNILGWNYDENFSALAKYSAPQLEALLPPAMYADPETRFYALAGRASFAERYSSKWHDALEAALSAVESTEQRIALKARAIEALTGASGDASVSRSTH